MSNVIKVPKPSGTVFDPKRSLEKNHLIQSQVLHFKEAERQLPKKFRTRVNIANVKTEGQASNYIRKITRAIHKAGGQAVPKVKKAT